MSDVKYDPELCERLVREAREDNESIPCAPWRVTKGHAEASGNRYFPSLLTHEPISFYDRVVINDSITGKPTTMEKYDAIADAMARQRNNLAAMADQLEAARAELSRIAAVQDRALEGCTPPASAVSLSEFVEWLDNFERHASERAGLRDQLEAARREIEQYRADLAVAAGECLVPVEEMPPGSHLRRVVMANRMWRYERDRMQLVVDAALASYGSQRGGHFGQPRPTDAMLELAAAIDAYRAAKVET